jgi:Mn-dependent DtxR family transcriptional regulator
MTKLKISESLQLPLEAGTETIAVLGIRGSGKTNTAAVIAEELLRAGQQVVIIDPTDAWWGLKSSDDGSKPGYPVVVLGGKRGDLPLNSGDGKLIADFVVEQGVSVICSLRGFESKNQELAFVTSFLRRLYHLKGQQEAPTPVTLFIDEASRLIPQRVMGEDANCVGAVQQIVRQGRSSGFGVVLIDQRAATVNKDVLAQLEMLVAHRTTSPQDRKALREWIAAHDTEGHESEFLESLASLKQGEAWFWSPGWLDLFEKVQVRARKTFDSSRTPRAGEVVVTPKRIAEVDLETLKTQLAATIEKAKADDPKVLRSEIATLKKQLASAAPDPQAIERAVAIAVRHEHGRFVGMLTRWKDEMRVLGQLSESLTNFAHDLAMSESTWRIDLDATVEVLTAEDSRGDVQLGNTQKGTGANRPSASTVPPQSRSTPRRPVISSAGGDSSLPRGEKATLIAIAQYEDGAERDTLTVLTGFKRSTRDAYIQRLRERGYVDTTSSRIRATDAGVAALGSEYEPLPTGRELQSYWLNRLPVGEKKILEVLVEANGKPIARADLDDRVGYQRSSRDAYLQRLGSRRLVESVGRGEVRASATLFD